MKLKEILNDIKLGGLALIIASCSTDPREKIIERYLQAINEIDLEKIRSYCTERKDSTLYAPQSKLKILKKDFEDCKIYSYIPREGLDNDNIYWVKKKSGYYAKFVLVEQNGEWKIDEISSGGD